MKLELKGATRIVLVIGEYAIKVPNFRYCWHHFLQGLVANINETQTWRDNSGAYATGKEELLCPVLWASWGGWLLVMRRAVPCRWLGEDGEEIEYSKWIVAGFGGDDKPANYGTIEGRIVKLDYAQ